MIVTPSAIVPVAAAITPTATASVKASLTSGTIQSFDWLTFFWGGAVGSFIGAFIILNIERLLDWILGVIKAKKEKGQIIIALKAEIESSIKICDDSSFAHFFGGKIEFTPHFVVKMATKMAFIPHLAMTVSIK